MDLRHAVLFEGSQDRVQGWTAFLKATRPRRVAEVGVWQGEFAEAVLRECDFIETYYLIDPWKHLADWNKPYNVTNEQFEEVYREALARTEFAKERRVVLRGRTREVAGQLADDSLDFIYIDGDHTLRGITLDLLLLFSKVRQSGFIGGDDFSTAQWVHGAGYEPNAVFPFAVYFAEAMNSPIRALPFDQFLLQRAQTGFTFIDPSGKYAHPAINPPPVSYRQIVLDSIGKPPA
jgi:hypothetical protein